MVAFGVWFVSFYCCSSRGGFGFCRSGVKVFSFYIDVESVAYPQPRFVWGEKNCRMTAWMFDRYDKKKKRSVHSSVRLLDRSQKKIAKIKKG